MNIKIQNDNNYISEEKKITPLIVKSETKKWYIHTLSPNLDNRNIDFVTDKVIKDDSVSLEQVNWNINYERITSKFLSNPENDKIFIIRNIDTTQENIFTFETFNNDDDYIISILYTDTNKIVVITYFDPSNNVQTIKYYGKLN